MRFLILGPLEVRGAQGVVALGGNKPRGLLAVLLLHANEAVSAERLVLALWGEDAPAGAVKTVQVHVSRLRTALGDRRLIATTAAGYCLRVGPDELDVARFERLADDGRRALAGGRPDQAGALLREALGLWRGPALAELACAPFAQAEIPRLEEQRLAALEARVEADLACGRHAELVGELRRLVAADPTRECLAAQLMLALYRCGRQTDALEAYQDARRALVADVGVEPGPRLRELQDAILRHDAALDSRGAPAVPAVRPARETASVPPPAGREDEPAVPALARPLQVPPHSLFVGRDHELARLREHWRQAQDGARSAVVISGEPGIGKTRLASELAHEVHEQGALVLYGRCDEGLAVPYQPFVEALGSYARAAGVDRLRAELGQLAPALGRLLPELGGLGEPVQGDPESERFALFEAVAALIEATTLRQPALLILDDLHWAPRPTLLLLRHLIRSERPLSVLLLGTYRATELDPGESLSQLLADLHRDQSVRLLSMGGLNERAIAALLEAAVGSPLDEHGSQLVRVLEGQTAGNPFFVRELLAHLAESDRIVDGSDRSRPSAAAARLEVPESLRHVIGERVARLSAPASRVLLVAAAAGPTFSFALLERVLGEQPSLLDALDEAVAAGLLIEAERSEYAFAHALVRQTTYEQLGAARRPRVHRQLGEALEELGDTEAHLEALAEHFAQAAPDGQGAKAAKYALAAGRSATARLGYEEAAAHYERGLQALTLTSESRERQRCELLLALGAARWGAGEPDEARRAYARAAELAGEVGDATALARAALGFCGPYRFELVAAMHGPITSLLEQALGALGTGDSPLRAQLLGRLAAHTDIAHRAPALAREALQMARRVGDRATLADVLASYLWATRGPDALHESLAVTHELKRVADELDDSRMGPLARVWLLDFLLELGDVDGVQRELEVLQQLADTRKEGYVGWLLTTRQASRAHLRGRLEECERLAHAVFASQFEGPDANAMICGTQMFFIRREQGRLHELMEEIEGFVEHHSHPRLLGWRCALAYIYAQLGRTAQARQQLDVLARGDFEDLLGDAFWLSNLTMLSEVVAVLGDAARARLLYAMLSPYADRCVVVTALLCWGSASRPLGLLASTLSRHEAAERHFEHALTMDSQIGSPLLIAHTQLDYADMLVGRNQAGDHRKALQLLNQEPTAEQLGLTVLADRARSLKLKAQAGQPPLTLVKAAAA
jgi:DNA-binding SARP family transcriptional activator